MRAVAATLAACVLILSLAAMALMFSARKARERFRQRPSRAMRSWRALPPEPGRPIELPEPSTQQRGRATETPGGVSASAATETVVAAPTMGVVARGVSWKVLSVVLGQGSWYTSLFVLAILVPPRYFGVVAIGTAVVSVTLGLLESGTGGALIIAPDLSPAWVRRSLLRTSAAGVVATGLFFVLAGPIADAFTGGLGVGALRAIGFTLLLAAIAIVPNALLSKHLRFKAAAIIQITGSFVASVAAIVAAVLGAGVWALAIRLLVSQLIIVVLTCVAARDLIPLRAPGKASIPRRAGAVAFMLIAGATFVAWTGDNLVVGAFTNPTQLGLYALGFSLAFAPLTQVSWTVGQVLLPSIAAARDEAVVRRQTLKAVRIMALLLLPLVPPAIAVAPGLIPAVLGRKWDGMVVPFQILVGVGVGYGVLNILGEALAGAGVRSVNVRARIDVIWALATIAAIVVGVRLGGIRGAALAHIATFCGLAFAYAWRGARGIGLPITALPGAVGRVVACVAVQALITTAVTLGLEHGGSGWLAAGLVGASAGILALLAALRLRAPDLLDEGRAVVAAGLRRRAA